MDNEVRKYTETILARNHVTLDELMPLCKTYQDVKEWAEDIKENYSEYADLIPTTTEAWDEDVVNHMWDEWCKIVWNAIKGDKWILGSTCGRCLQVLREDYLESQKWYIPLPKRFN